MVIWKKLAGGPAGLFDVYELVPAFVLALLAIVIVSLLGRPPATSIVTQHDAFLARLNRDPVPGDN